MKKFPRRYPEGESNQKKVQGGQASKPKANPASNIENVQRLVLILYSPVRLSYNPYFSACFFS